jgi:surface antigen
MRRQALRGAAFAVSMTVLVSGCAVTPQDCQLNQTATGALVGAGVGGVLGGIAAAASGMHSGAGLGVALGAALVGAAIGAAVGHHNDEVCHQMALQQALDQAIAANAAWQAREEQRQADEAASAAAAEAQAHPAPHAHAAATPAEPVATAPRQPEYMSVAWANKMTNTTGSITPLNSVTAPASDQVCMEFADTTTVSGETKNVTGKACRSSDGKWNLVP